MTKARPQMEPGGVPGSEPVPGMSGAASMPSVNPPAGTMGMSKGDCGCSEGVAGGMMSATAPGASIAEMGGTAPSLRPAEGVGSSITAWQNNKRITGLWSISENRNSWVHVDGVGWKRLANNSDSAIVALTMLGAHAREKASAVNYREETDGMIREMYVW